MRFFQLSLVAISLPALSGAVAGIGLPDSSFKRDVQLAVELGLDPGLIIRDRAAFRAMASHSGGNGTEAEFATIPIDHWNSSVGTYQNRYWVDDQHYRPGGPVFVYDGGELNAAMLVHSQFKNSTSLLQEYLREFNGMGIIWEHRYYGESLPFPVSRDMPQEHLEYLSTEQALADLPYFAKNFSRGNCDSGDLRPHSTPWIMIGGSYAGAPAAFTRNEYPETIYAAYALSAPVHAQVNISAYYDQVYRGMIANGYSNCVKDLQAAMEYVDDQLANNETAAAIKQLFFGRGAETNSNGDFTTALTGIYFLFQTHGMEGLNDLCRYLETDRATNQTGPDGLAPTYDNKFAAERLASWPIFTPLVNFNFDTNCRGLNDSIPRSCVLGRPIAEPDKISWAWQYCTEWGFFQVDNTGPRSLVSRYQTVEYFQAVCNQHFNEAFRSGLLPPHPRVKALNGQTGGWTIRPSNVYWTGGQFDPWRPLTLLSTEERAPTVSYSTDIPACGAVHEDRLFAYIMDNAEHCADLRMDFEPAAVARRHFAEALRRWLPCFEKKRGGLA